VARLKQSTTHVEAGVELFRDAGSIPAASTFDLCCQRMTLGDKE
jgi:hypothetical protein